MRKKQLAAIALLLAAVVYFSSEGIIIIDQSTIAALTFAFAILIAWAVATGPDSDDE